MFKLGMTVNNIMFRPTIDDLMSTTELGKLENRVLKEMTSFMEPPSQNSIYTDAKHASEESWNLKDNDYFPYANRENAYWTRYFTSRPAIKRYVRLLSGYYLAARQLEYFKGRNVAGPATDRLGIALGVSQHHDAVSGTEQQHVANDYATRLSIGHMEAETLVATTLSCLTESPSKSRCKNMGTQFKECPLLNISYCPASEVNLSPGQKLDTNDHVMVLDSTGKEIQSQILPVLNASLALKEILCYCIFREIPRVQPSLLACIYSCCSSIGL